MAQAHAVLASLFAIKWQLLSCEMARGDIVPSCFIMMPQTQQAAQLYLHPCAGITPLPPQAWDSFNPKPVIQTAPLLLNRGTDLLHWFAG